MPLREWLTGLFGDDFSSRTQIHESPTYGRVLEIALVGSYRDLSRTPEVLSRMRKIIEEGVAQHRPQYLVLNLLEFDSEHGYYLARPLVSGALALQKLGGGRKMGIMAAGRTAARLDEFLRLAKLQAIFGGRICSDLESALSALRSMPALANCELQIFFSKPAVPPPYAPGEKVSGVVRVSAGEELTCRKLTVKYQWRDTPDTGATQYGPEHELPLFSGTWHANEIRWYPFEFIAPTGPLTDRSTRRDLEWYLRAGAELSDSFEVSVEEVFAMTDQSSDEFDFVNATGQELTRLLFQRAEERQSAQSEPVSVSTLLGAALIVVAEVLREPVETAEDPGKTADEMINFSAGWLHTLLGPATQKR